MEPIDPIREFLAAYSHEAWAGWMQYMFGKGTFNDDGTWTMPADSVKRWKRQMDTPYSDLPDGENKSDLAEADKILAVFKEVYGVPS